MTITKRVERELERSTKARNSDQYLIIALLQSSGANFTSEQLELLQSISFETIRRTRQKIQAEGRYKADRDVEQYRATKAMRIQQNEPTASVEWLGKLLDDRDEPKAVRWFDDTD